MVLRSFNTILEWDAEERVWVTYVPALDFLSTYGQTKEEAIGNTREAILGYIEAAGKEGLQIF
jgi:predicted RNase H-like HicB family nuclease